MFLQTTGEEAPSLSLKDRVAELLLWLDISDGLLKIKDKNKGLLACSFRYTRSMYNKVANRKV